MLEVLDKLGEKYGPWALVIGVLVVAVVILYRDVKASHRERAEESQANAKRMEGVVEKNTTAMTEFKGAVSHLHDLINKSGGGT